MLKRLTELKALSEYSISVDKCAKGRTNYKSSEQVPPEHIKYIMWIYMGHHKEVKDNSLLMRTVFKNFI